MYYHVAVFLTWHWGSNLAFGGHQKSNLPTELCPQPSISIFVCLSVFYVNIYFVSVPASCQLHTNWSHFGRGNSPEELLASNWPVGVSLGHCFPVWRMQPTGAVPPRAGGPGSYKKAS